LGGGGTSFVIFLKAKKLKVGEILEKCIFNECGLNLAKLLGKKLPQQNFRTKMERNSHPKNLIN